jgi:hypothetical protein
VLHIAHAIGPDDVTPAHIDVDAGADPDLLARLGRERHFRDLLEENLHRLGGIEHRRLEALQCPIDKRGA